MAQEFFGKLTGVSPIGSGSNSYVRIRGDVSNGGNTITNIVGVSGYKSGSEFDFLKSGMVVVGSTGYGSGATIASINSGTQTITMNSNSNADGTNALFRISPASGSYYIESASFTDPQGLINTKTITGSGDSEANASMNVFSILGVATLGGSDVTGRFHQYNITDVKHRNTAGSEISMLVEWGEPGNETDSGDRLSVGTNQTIPIVSLTATSSLAPLFSRAISGMGVVPPGSDVAAYQIALQTIQKFVTSSTGGGGGITFVGSTEDGLLTFTSGSANTVSASQYVQIKGDELIVSGNVFVQGTLDAHTKNFKIDHPTKEGYYLIHSSLEGPERGIYHRGKLETSDTIFLPEYWKDLANEINITVQLTPVGNSCQHWIKSISKEQIEVGCDCGTPNCHYIVYAERTDQGEFELLESKE